MLIRRKTNPPNPLNPRFIVEDAASDVKFRSSKLALRANLVLNQDRHNYIPVNTGN